MSHVDDRVHASSARQLRQACHMVGMLVGDQDSVEARNILADRRQTPRGLAQA